MLLYTGKTGSGKSYRAIHDCLAIGTLTIAVPCRQLAYDMFMDYKAIDTIQSGDVYFRTLEQEINKVMVYESLSLTKPVTTDSLFIDEAHYLMDHQRGGRLLEAIMTNMNAGKNIVLATATNNLSRDVISLLNITIEELPQLHKPKIVYLSSMEDFARKVRKGLSTIIFTKFVPTASDVDWYARKLSVKPENIAILSASSTPTERITTQLAFKNGDIKIIISTNVLAQGVNFPASCVLVEHNENDGWEIVEQKLGRVARFGYSKTGYVLVGPVPQKYSKRGIPEVHVGVIPDYKASELFIPSAIIAERGFVGHEVPIALDSYRDIRYSRRFLEWVLSAYPASKTRKELAALSILEDESKAVMKMLIEQRNRET